MSTQGFGTFEEELDRRRMEEAEDPNAIPIITYLNQYECVSRTAPVMTGGSNRLRGADLQLTPKNPPELFSPGDSHIYTSFGDHIDHLCTSSLFSMGFIASGVNDTTKPGGKPAETRIVTNEVSAGTH